MKIPETVAVVTGAAGGIGQAVALELAQQNAKGIALVDLDEKVQAVADSINQTHGDGKAIAFAGDVTKEDFIRGVYRQTQSKFGTVNACVPAAGITRDGIAVKIDKETGKVVLYDREKFRLVLEVNLVAPLYWAMELIATIAVERKAKGLKQWNPEEGILGSVVFIGSISSRGNIGQVAYSATKAGLVGASASLMVEGMNQGVRTCVVHPGFTDTPMVQAIGEDYINEKILPNTKLRRLIQPVEIAQAICFMLSNPAVTKELWVDAGWRPPF